MTVYITLFIWSFLASTIIPIGVEAYFLYLVSESQELWWLCIIASIGNTLGGITILLMGILGFSFLQKKLDNEKAGLIQKATFYIKKYGYPTLLLSWVPIIGDILVLIVGLTKPKMIPCIIYLAIGKTARFITLGWLVLA